MMLTTIFFTMTTMTKKKIIAMTHAGLLLLSLCGSGALLKETQAFSSAPPPITCLSSFSSRTSSSSQPSSKSTCCSLKMADKPPAGSFFHEVPPSDDDSSSSNEKEGDDENNDIVPDFDESISQLIRKRREPPLASRPSTIDGVPTEKAGTGFGKSQNSSSTGVQKEKPTTKPYVAIGEPDNKQQPINDPSKPERDDQGYTLYTDTETGKKSRVFEALIEYPSIFTMKIVGANEGLFVEEIVAVVAEACESEFEQINHSTKVNGKWVSVTCHAPVQNAEMLYALYEKIDLDPRVKFKF